MLEVLTVGCQMRLVCSSDSHHVFIIIINRWCVQWVCKYLPITTDLWVNRCIRRWCRLTSSWFQHVFQWSTVSLFNVRLWHVLLNLHVILVCVLCTHHCTWTHTPTVHTWALDGPKFRQRPSHARLVAFQAQTSLFSVEIFRPCLFYACLRQGLAWAG